MKLERFTRQSSKTVAGSCARLANGPCGAWERGFTLVEMMVATSISVFALTTVMVSFVFMSRAFNAIGAYTDLDNQSRYTLDVMSHDIRQAGHLTNWTSTGLWFTNLDGNILEYSFNTNTGVLTYTNGTTGNYGILLSNCVSLSFSIFQRTPTNGPVSFYAAGNAVSAKGILMTFGCLRTNYAGITTSETIETASIVMRN
jgi:prepilin-type N-terminal cleavage/methylation domain-containing protein